MAESRPEKTPDGAGKTCGTCGVRYLKRNGKKCLRRLMMSHFCEPMSA